MDRRRLIVLSLLAVTACDRGPEPAPLEEGADESEAPSEPAEQTGRDVAAARGEGTSAPPSPHGPSAGEPSAAGLIWKAPAPFEERPTDGQWRVAEYVVPEQEEGQDAANMRVYFFGPQQGGSIDDNVARWKGQFEPPEGKTMDDVAKVERRTVGDDIEVTFVDVRGTFQPMQMPGKAPRGPQRDQRMLAAIADGPKGRVFFKLVGPNAVVTTAEEAFEKTLESLEPAG